MNLFKTAMDHSRCLKRKDHWIGTLIFATLATGIYLVAKNDKNCKNSNDRQEEPKPEADS